MIIIGYTAVNKQGAILMDDEEALVVLPEKDMSAYPGCRAIPVDFWRMWCFAVLGQEFRFTTKIVCERFNEAIKTHLTDFMECMVKPEEMPREDVDFIFSYTVKPEVLRIFGETLPDYLLPMEATESDFNKLLNMLAVIHQKCEGAPAPFSANATGKGKTNIRWN